MATPLCDDPKAYAAIPDEFFECLLPNRHAFSLRASRQQYVRMTYADGETLDMIEQYSTCGNCKCVRTLLRDRGDRTWLTATYVYPDGYLAPPGTRWDKVMLWTEYYSRFPIKGRVDVRSR